MRALPVPQKEGPRANRDIREDLCAEKDRLLFQIREVQIKGLHRTTNQSVIPVGSTLKAQHL